MNLRTHTYVGYIILYVYTCQLTAALFLRT